MMAGAVGRVETAVQWPTGLPRFLSRVAVYTARLLIGGGPFQPSVGKTARLVRVLEWTAYGFLTPRSDTVAATSSWTVC